jgi:hypothetical protein
MVELAKIIVHKTTGHCLLRRRIPARAKKAVCVSVEFDDPVWDGLVKTVVFRGNGKKIADFDGEIAIVPWEVLENPGPSLWFGIWGSDPDTGLQLPLIEVRIGTIEESTDPDADPGTDPTLPIWAQLKQDVEELKKGGTGGAQSDWNAAEGEPGHILNRTHWTEGGNVEVLPETSMLVDEGDGTFYTTGNIPLVDGAEITVNWNGTPYKCGTYAFTPDLENGKLVVFGNSEVLAEFTGMETEENTAPFFGLYSAIHSMLVMLPLDESSAATVAIYSAVGKVHKLDNKYLNLDWLPVRTHAKGEIVAERTGSANYFGTAWFGQATPYNVTPGEYYFVVWNGDEYRVQFEPGTGEHVYGSFSSNAFKIMYVYDSSEVPSLRYGFRCRPLDGSTEVALSIYESVAVPNKIPDEFLPDDFGGNVDLTGVVKTVNGKTPDENGNVEITIPDSGGNADQVSVEPADDDIPMVFLTGDEFGNMTNEKNEVKMVMDYISKTDSFRSPIKIKYQGSSSLSYAKKNFTIKMYEDDAYNGKLKKAFRDWGVKTNKYVLKANFIDHSHARNIVGANLWSQIVASRPDYDTLPEEMRNSPRNGAIDGFPIKVYVNGTYQGLYTWNIGKDDWMWGMDEDNPNHVLMCAETNDNGTKIATPCNFRALWNGVNETHWSVEVGTNSTALKNSLNNLIQFVMDNDGDAFRNGIGNYLDIQSAIDYYLYQYAICGHDALGKNLLLATYDGTKWICGAYDMDGTFGLYQDGKKFLPANYACPEQYQETNSLLWERIEANFVNELKARYAELRISVLSVSNMFATFERFTNRINSDLYAEDLTIYTAIPLGSTNNIKQIRDYIRDRLAYVDGEIGAMSLPVPCAGISLDKSTLTFSEAGSQTLTATVTPDGCTDAIMWESDNTSIATVLDGVVTAVANGSCNITASCGEHSASCSVSVSGISEEEPEEPVEPDAGLLYSLPEATTFDGTNYIDTGVKLFDEPKDFTLLADLDLSQANRINYTATIFAFEEGAPKAGIYFYYYNGAYYFGGAQKGANYRYVPDALNGTVKKIAITATNGVISRIHYATESSLVSPSVNVIETFKKTDQTMLLGAYIKNGVVDRHWKGTINKLKVYDAALAGNELFTALGFPNKYGVISTLNCCTISNSANIVDGGTSYSAVITANDNLILDSVIVTHNGESVAVVDGAFTIDSIAGDIIIEANAVPSEYFQNATYSLQNFAKTFDNGVALEVSDDNRVKIVGGATNVVAFRPNILNSNASISQASKFTVHAGDVAKVIFVTTSGNNFALPISIDFVTANSTTTKYVFNREAGELVHSTLYEQETTFTDDAEIGCIALWLNSLKADTILEFDLYIYVNDVLLIGKGGTTLE